MATIQIGAQVTMEDGVTAIAQERLYVLDTVEQWRLARAGDAGVVYVDRGFNPSIDYGHVAAPRSFIVGAVVSVGGSSMSGTVIEVESSPADSDVPMYRIQVPGRVVNGEQYPDYVVRAPGHRLNLS